MQEREPGARPRCLNQTPPSSSLPPFSLPFAFFPCCLPLLKFSPTFLPLYLLRSLFFLFKANKYFNPYSALGMELGTILSVALLSPFISLHSFLFWFLFFLGLPFLCPLSLSFGFSLSLFASLCLSLRVSLRTFFCVVLCFLTASPPCFRVSVSSVSVSLSLSWSPSASRPHQSSPAPAPSPRHPVVRLLTLWVALKPAVHILVAGFFCVQKIF